ncbi:MAG: FtsX-like permease family protein [Verrucomicrobia bacterium]|nr:FtsX-like permease family protein [Verrucomicrobiota bacterium]
MTLTGFIAKNALRNKRRLSLSVTSVAVSLFLLVVLQVALRELTNPINDEGSSLRIIVRNKVSLAQPLPARQLQVLERIPGIAAITPFTFYGGLYKGDEKFTSFAQFAVDPARTLPLITDAKVPREQLEAWLADRTSCIVGKMTADRYGLKIGDRMQFTSQLYPADLEFKIVGIYEGTADDRNVFFHHKYLDESLGNPGTVGTWWVRAASIEEAPLVTARINQAFANSSAEVRAESERAFVLGFVSMWGNIQTLIGGISVVVVFALLLVTVSTMSMAIRERFRELAILKAIGFRRRELFAFILAESFGLAMLGGVLGVGGAYLLCNSLDIQKLSNGLFLLFEVTPRMVGFGFSVAALLGVLAAAAPMMTVARTSVVEGLKTLD